MDQKKQTRLIITRHGNTFEPGETPVMVGAREDVPLAQKGKEQAQAVGAMLRRSGIEPALAVTSHLKRTWTFAALALDGMDTAHRQDPRLSEIDYGPWGGLTNDEIAELGGKEALEAWNKKSVWPTDAGWQPGPEALAQGTCTLAQDLVEEHTGNDVFLVSSNGVMRYFLQLVPGAFDTHIKDGTFKVKTGHVCVLVCCAGHWSVAVWNSPPEDAPL